MEFPLTIAYNMEEKKVGCVLLQPALGTSFKATAQLFDAEMWDLSPTKLKVYTVKNKEEMNRIIQITYQHHGYKKWPSIE